MSIRILTWVWDNSPHKGTLLLLLLALADAANDDGVCWPGLNRLAKKARVDRRHVVRLIEELEQCGSIQVYRRKEGKLNKSNVYRVVTLEPLPSDSSVTTGSDSSVTRVVTLLSPEPSLNRNSEPSINRKRGAQTRRPREKDPRTDHPAIQTIKKVTGNYPQKAAYDYLIARLGETPDTVQFKDAFTAWTAAGFSPRNYGGILDWYESGQRKPGQQNGSGKKSYMQDAKDILARMKAEALAEKEAARNGREA